MIENLTRKQYEENGMSDEIFIDDLVYPAPPMPPAAPAYQWVTSTPMPTPIRGDRFNTGKTKLGLISPYANEEEAKVLTFGCNKYGAWNWEKGLSFTDTYDSLQRHLNAWIKGEDVDPETGLSHMAHVRCNASFLLHFIATGRTDLDDRHMFRVDNK